MSWVRVLVAAGAAVASAGLLAVLMADHTVGGEIDGVIVAGIAVVTGVAGVVSLVRGGTRRRWVLAAWLVVAAGGVMGYLDHTAPPLPGRPDLDERPRPRQAPFVFTVIGLVGVATVVRLPATSRRPVAGGPIEA